MSQVDEILNSLEVSTHEHDVIDTDKTFTIDPFARNIIADSGQKTIIVQGDHNSERFTFTMPRYIEGHDMALCNLIYVPYINSEPEGRNARFKTGVYPVNDLTIVPDKDKVTFSWLISGNATKYEGNTTFSVLFSCVTGKRVDYRWSTNFYEELYVLKSLDSELSFENEYVEVIEAWKEAVKAEFAEFIELTVANNVFTAKEELDAGLKADFETYSAKIDKNLETFDTILRTEATRLSAEMEVQKARMDTFVSLKEGSTTGDAELTDIRIGANGKIYNSAGEAVREQVNLLSEECELIKISPIYDKYVSRFIGEGYLAKSTETFKVSNEIVIPEWANTIIIDGLIGNQYISHCVFISDKEAVFESNDASLTNYVYSLSPGTEEQNSTILERQIIDIPSNAKAFMVSNNTDSNGTEYPFKVYFIRKEMIDYVENLGIEVDNVIELTGLNKGIDISLPSSYQLVVGDTFELFYKGIINVVDPSKYDIRVSCDKGNAYKRKYVWTPESNDTGQHEFVVSIYNDFGILISSSSTILNVVSSPATVQNTNVLCIGDSLTAGGEWVSEVKRKLVNSGYSNVEFIGKKNIADGINYEATGGWFYTNYLAKNSENPFYNADNDSVDFAKYVIDCGADTIDICIILIGWNGSTYAENDYKKYVTELIGLLKKSYPDITILLFGVQVPSIDGLGENYGCSWIYKNTVDFVFNLDRWHKDITNNNTNVRAVNISGQFDTEYNMPGEERAVNIRSNRKEIVGINGIHPDISGYLQIADVAYRELIALMV